MPRRARRFQGAVHGFAEAFDVSGNPYVISRVLAFRPFALPDNDRAVRPVPILRNKPEEIRLAFHDDKFAINEPDFIELLSQLRSVQRLSGVANSEHGPFGG